jgi:hypothetical protein
MSDTAHTPGPWIVEPINDGQTYQITTSERTGFTIIAETETGNSSDKANASLMAAAPEMFALLVRLEAQFGQAIDNDAPISGSEAVEFLSELVPQARAVIAKAKDEDTPTGDLGRLLNAAKAVVVSWEGGDLAGSVRRLSGVIDEINEDVSRCRPDAHPHVKSSARHDFKPR